MSVEETPTVPLRELIDRLAVYGVRYLVGGSEWDGDISPYCRSADVPVGPLLLDLARAPDARLRNALVALFLRYPDATGEAERLARALIPDDPARRLLLISIAVAAALQSEWSFALGLYLPDQRTIRADQLAAELGLPSPQLDFGRPCLHAAADLLRETAPFPFNYEAGWEEAVHRLLAQLVREARHDGA